MPDIETVYSYYLSCSDHTTKDRDQYAYNRLSVFFTQTDLREIKRTDLRQYVQHRRAQNIADSTINRELRSLRAALNFWLTDHHDTSLNPLARFSLTEPDNIETYLTRSQARHLLNHCIHNPALFWYVRLLLATGCRSGQILKMTWSQVDFNRRLFLFSSTATKSRKRLVLPMSLSAEACLLEIKDVQTLARYQGDSVFGGIQSLKKSFHNARVRAGLPHIRIHDLRHTYASWLIQNGVGIYQVQRLLGHSRIESTLRYAHLDVEHLRQFIDKDLFKSYYGCN